MFFSSGATFAVQFATTVLLARLFTPAEFGQITSILVLVGYADLLWQAGVAQAIIQKKEVSDEDIVTAHRLTVGLGLAACTIVCLAAAPLGAVIGISSPVLLLVSTVFPISAAGSVPLALVQRRLEFRVVLLKDVLEAVAYGIVGAILGLLGWGVEGLVVAVLIKTMAGALVPILYARIPRGSRFTWATARRLLRFGAGASLAGLLNTTARNADYLVVLRTMDAAALGLYSRAYQLVTIPANVLGQVIDRVLFPAFSRLQADRDALGRVYVTTSALLAAVYLPGGVLLHFLSQDVVFLLLGGEWSGVSEPLGLLALFLFFRVGYKVADPIARSLGAVYSNALLQGVYTALVFVCAFAGSFLGLTGIAFGVGVALVLNYLAVTVYTWTLVRFDIARFFAAMLVPAAAQVAGFVASWFARGYIEGSRLAIPAGALVAAVLIVIQGLVVALTLVCWPRPVRAAVIRSLRLRKKSR